MARFLVGLVVGGSTNFAHKSELACTRSVGFLVGLVVGFRANPYRLNFAGKEPGVDSLVCFFVGFSVGFPHFTHSPWRFGTSESPGPRKFFFLWVWLLGLRISPTS